MGIVFLLLVLCIFVLVFFINQDVFGPTKLYFAYLLAFFIDIFLNPQTTAVYTAYFGLVFIGLFAALFESKRLSYSPFRSSKTAWKWTPRRLSRGLWIVWLLSLLPIGMLIYVMFLQGGFQDFVNSIGNRVLAWRGLGPLLIFVGWFPLLNLLYFSILIQNRVSRWQWFAFLFHFGVLVGMGLLMGSRGVLNSFLAMMLAYNYLKKNISLKTAATAGATLLFVALLLGTLRSGLKWTDEGLQTGFETQRDTFETGSLNGGVIPLQLVYGRDPFQLQYGLTFLTAITNLIPRDLWPEKPDTGGIVLTDDYMSGRWGGASNLSTGIIAEGVINFGPWMGTAFGFILLGFFMLGLAFFYQRVRRRQDFFDILLYSSFLLCVTGLLVGEFTNMIVSTLMTKLIPIFLIRYLILRGDHEKS